MAASNRRDQSSRVKTLGTAWEADALPTELRPRSVHRSGVPTFRPSRSCPTHAPNEVQALEEGLVRMGVVRHLATRALDA